MDIYELIIANFIGFLFALLVALLVYGISQYYLNYGKNKKEMIMQNNFLNLIKNEAIFNKSVLEKILKHDFTKGETLLRLKTENKEGCWSKVMEFRHNNPGLIDEISLLYEMFRAINHVLNFEPLYIEDGNYFKKFCNDRKESIIALSKTCFEELEDVMKIIDRELK